MKPNYKNWVPKGMVTGFTIGAAGLGLASIGLSLFGKGRAAKALGAVSTLGA